MRRKDFGLAAGAMMPGADPAKMTLSPDPLLDHAPGHAKPAGDPVPGALPAVGGADKPFPEIQGESCHACHGNFSQGNGYRFIENAPKAETTNGVTQSHREADGGDRLPADEARPRDAEVFAGARPPRKGVPGPVTTSRCFGAGSEADGSGSSFMSGADSPQEGRQPQPVTRGKEGLRRWRDTRIRAFQGRSFSPSWG